MKLNELTRPLDISDIDFRVQSINNGGYATVLAYKSARVDMARLDAAAGPLGWQRKHEFINGKLFCHVGIYSAEYVDFVWKSDVGTESMTEAAKGESSDSFKRACFNWGIGRELYDYPIISVKLNDNEWDKSSGKPKQTYNLKIKDWKWYSEFTDGRLSFLAAKDENGKLRFKWGEMKPKEIEPEYKPASTEQEVQPEPVSEPVVKAVVDEANVQGILKKSDDNDDAREALVAEYNTLYGKKPDKRMKNETIQKAIDEAPIKEITEEMIEEAKAVESELPLDSIKDMYGSIELFRNAKEFISWAKDIAAAFIETESEENMEEFKALCNAHYKKLIS
jgi:hypothetical protein